MICENPKVYLALKWMDEQLYTCASLRKTPRPPLWPIMKPQHPRMTPRPTLGMHDTLDPHVGINCSWVPMLGMLGP